MFTEHNLITTMGRTNLEKSVNSIDDKYREPCIARRIYIRIESGTTYVSSMLTQLEMLVSN